MERMIIADAQECAVQPCDRLYRLLAYGNPQMHPSTRTGWLRRCPAIAPS